MTTQIAFQQNAFFNPGFQTTSYSQMAFQKCAFDATAFQTDPCEEPSGRSGYWRLFFYQMQEEALKQYEEKTGKPVAKPEPVEITEPAAKKAKAAKKPKPVPVVEEFPEVARFERKPIYTAPTPANENLPVWLMSVSVELQQMYASFYPHIVAQQVRISQQAEAANDADIRLRLLLLAA